MLTHLAFTVPQYNTMWWWYNNLISNFSIGCDLTKNLLWFHYWNDNWYPSSPRFPSWSNLHYHYSWHSHLRFSSNWSLCAPIITNEKYNILDSTNLDNFTRCWKKYSIHTCNHDILWLPEEVTLPGLAYFFLISIK